MSKFVVTLIGQVMVSFTMEGEDSDDIHEKISNSEVDFVAHEFGNIESGIYLVHGGLELSDVEFQALDGSPPDVNDIHEVGS